MQIFDGDWRLFDHDIRTGRTVWKFDHGDGRVTFRTDYPVENLVKANKQELNDHAGARWGDGRVAARIPKNIFWEQLAPAIQQEDDKYVSKWLNDSDHDDFRTFRGKV